MPAGQVRQGIEGIDPIVVALAIALASKRPLVTGAGAPSGTTPRSVRTGTGAPSATPRSRAPRPTRKG